MSKLMGETVVKILNYFPEVVWDRWTGQLNSEQGIGVFGWISRRDGRQDFLFLRIDTDGAWLMSTSSAKHSKDFSERLGFKVHTNCKKVSGHFPTVKKTL